MATVELRWTEERVDNLIALLEEKPYLYNTKLRGYFNRDKKESFNEIYMRSSYRSYSNINSSNNIT